MPVMRLLLDPGIGALLVFAYLSTAATLWVSLSVVAIEAAALVLMRWGSIARSLAASVAMNLLSFAVGFAILMLVIFLGSEDEAVALLDRLPGLMGYWIAAWLVSVLSEAPFLQALRRRGSRRRLSWYASLVANVASYVLLILVMSAIGPPQRNVQDLNPPNNSPDRGISSS